MPNVKWWTVNEAVDDEGFFLDGEALIAAEKKELRSMGAPDVDSIANVEVEIHDRSESTIEADVSQALADWMAEQEMLWEE